MCINITYAPPLFIDTRHTHHIDVEVPDGSIESGAGEEVLILTQVADMASFVDTRGILDRVGRSQCVTQSIAV